jgi:hypothetical protein
MFVCCECCVLSGKGLCDGLMTRPEESYRETSKTMRLKPVTWLWKIQTKWVVTPRKQTTKKHQSKENHHKELHNLTSSLEAHRNSISSVPFFGRKIRNLIYKLCLRRHRSHTWQP